MISIGKILIS